MLRPMGAAALLLAAALLAGCQKPTSASETASVDDFVDASGPSSLTASPSTDGRTYRIVRGNNQPDDIVAFQFKTSFTVTVALKSNAGDSKYDLSFPVTLTQATVKVNQASGGIITPPTSGDPERSDYVVTHASGNKLAGPSTSISMDFDVWYTMPSQLKEVVITVSFSMADDDGKTFAKTFTVNVVP